MKKIAAVALSGLLVASVFAGCSGGSAKDTYTVGICQSMQQPALDKATEGFKKALTDKLEMCIRDSQYTWSSSPMRKRARGSSTPSGTDRMEAFTEYVSSVKVKRCV